MKEKYRKSKVLKTEIKAGTKTKEVSNINALDQAKNGSCLRSNNGVI